MIFSVLLAFSLLLTLTLANKRYLILSFPDDTSIAQKMLVVASSIVYANLTDRALILPHKLAFYSNSNTYDHLFNATAKLIDPLDTFRHFACPNVTTNSGASGWWVDDVLHLTTNEYFLPALYLNREYRTKLEQRFPEYNPFKVIFEQHFKFDSQFLLKSVEDRYNQVTDYYGKTGEIIGIVLENASPYFADAKMILKCLNSSSTSEENIIHAITLLPQYYHFLQEHFPRLIFEEKTNRQNDLVILSEILFQVNYANRVIIYPNSPISHIIHALSPKKPSIYLRNALGGECAEINSHPEPCYHHSLKQYYQLCGERIGVDFNPHDPITRPLFIDTCKDAKIGIKIVLPIEDLPHQ